MNSEARVATFFQTKNPRNILTATASHQCAIVSLRKIYFLVNWRKFAMIRDPYCFGTGYSLHGATCGLLEILRA